MPGGKLAMLALLAALLAGLPARAAAPKPVIEIRALVDCAAPGGVRIAGQGGCMARDAIVKGDDFTAVGHLRFSRSRDLLVVTMSDAGRRRFYDFNRAHADEPVAVVIDGRLVSTPVMREPLHPATLEIPGLNGPQIDALVTRFRAAR